MQIENLSPEEFAALPDDQRQALLSGGEEMLSDPEPMATEPFVEQALEPPIEPVLPQVEAEQQPVRQGNPDVPLRAERERRRQAEAQLEQVQALLQNPQAMQAYLAQMGMMAPPQAEPAPELVIEDRNAVEHIVQQAIAPYQQTLQALQAQLAAAEQEKEMMALRSQFPDLDEMVSQFDAQAPHLAQQYDPQEKYLLMQGALMSDPAYQQYIVQEQARKMAEQMVAEQLKGLSGQGQRPVTLSGVTPAMANQEQAVDLNNLTPDQFNALPDAKRKALMGG